MTVLYMSRLYNKKRSDSFMLSDLFMPVNVESISTIFGGSLPGLVSEAQFPLSDYFHPG
jgi:hypothetical protein